MALFARIATSFVAIVGMLIGIGVTSVAPAAADDPIPTLFWANSTPSTIGTGSADGTGINQSFITSAGAPRDMAINDTHIYWNASDGIRRANYDGTGVVAVLSTTASYGIAVDADYVYWSTLDAGIHRANLDGSNPVTLIPQSAGISQARGITVSSDYIYWADYGGNKIGRANLDGTSPNASFMAAEDLPGDVAVNETHVFYSTSQGGRIIRANLDGTGASTLTFTGAPTRGLALGPDKVYWTTDSDADFGKYIGKANLDGTGFAWVTASAGNPWGIVVTPAPKPSPTAISPSVGATGGGTEVTITGANFAEGDTVTVGGVSCAPVVVSSDTSLTCTTGAHASGLVDVVVTGSDERSGTLAEAYYYTDNPAPSLSSVAPVAGSLSGGTEITLTGTGFLADAIVQVGGVECTNVVVLSATSLTCQTGAHAAGTVDVVVTNSDTQGATLAGAYTYQAAPTVSALLPTAGALAGGTSVTVTGTGFLADATVTVGGVTCTPVNIVSDTSLTCTTGAHAAGAVDVVVTNVDTQSGTLSDGYTYQAAPTITAVAPPGGPVLGGTSVTVTGTGFIAGATVQFDGDECTNVSVVSSTSITCTTPAHTAGVVGVTVTNADDQSAALADSYRYAAAPVVSAIDPAEGPTTGNTTITITGSDLFGASVTVDGLTCSNISVAATGDSLTCTTPAGTAGAVDVVVTAFGGSTTSVDGFTYVAAPTVSDVSPAGGPMAGGTSITVTGTGFEDATVTVGGNACLNVAVAMDGLSLTCDTPAGSGTADVVVTTVGGPSGPGTFTYYGIPTVSDLTPTAGPLAGGTTITVTGTNLSGAAVTVGGNTCASVTVNQAGTSLTCVTPAGTAGDATVAIATPGGSVADAGTFTYVPVPTISGVAPAAGPTAGGMTITLTGADLGGSSVTVGGQACTNVVVAVDGLSLTCVTPAGSPGAVDVVVTTVGGQSDPGTYTYVAAPTVSDVSPAGGPMAGGTSITVTGTGFEGATVTVGGNACLNVVVALDGLSLTCDTPAGSGAADVVVTTVGGPSGPGTFTYYGIPTVSDLTPTAGPLAGGTTITVTGTNLSGAAVTVGGNTCASVTVNQAGTSLTCVTPAGTAGDATVAITTPGGSVADAGTFTYVPVPTIGGVAPAAGTSYGGTTITVTGTGLTGSSVTVGGAQCTDVVVAMDGLSLTCVTPSGTEGAADVIVTTAGGSSSPGVFTYEVPAPTVEDVTPVVGPTGGGTTITVAGSGLKGATVTVGGAECTNVVINEAGTSLTCETPSGATGAATVAVTAPGGALADVGTFTYADAPVVTGYTPTSGTNVGGTTVTITGTNFSGGTVTIGGIACTNVQVNDSGEQLTCDTPALPAGVHPIVLATAGGEVEVGPFTANGSESATAPPNMPRDAKVKGKPTGNKFIVKWKVPTMTSDGRPVDRYRLTVKQAGVKKALLRKALASKITSYKLTRKYLLKRTIRPRGDMRVGMYRYIVYIEGFNSLGGGEVARTILKLKVRR